MKTFVLSRARLATGTSRRLSLAKRARKALKQKMKNKSSQGQYKKIRGDKLVMCCRPGKQANLQWHVKEHIIDVKVDVYVLFFGGGARSYRYPVLPE